MKESEAVNVLRKALEDYRNYSDSGYYDKVGLGFNLDDRFSALSMRLSMDSWKGQYGSSSCSRILSIPEGEVREYIIKYLAKAMTSMAEQILEKTIELMIEDSQKKLQQELKEAEKKVEQLRELLEKNE